MSHAIQYHQHYPSQPGFQFWRDRIVMFENFGMRWCIVIYGPLDDRFSGQKILEVAAVKAMSFAFCVSTSKRNLPDKLEAVLDFINEELIELKQGDQINIFSGIGIAITVVDSEGCMAYAQAGGAVVLLCHEQHRFATHSQDIRTLGEPDCADIVQQRRNFGTCKAWSGYVSPELQLTPGDGWFISTEGNFLIMHDQVPYDEIAGTEDWFETYFNLIRRAYNSSGLQYAGIVAAAEYSAAEVHDIIGMKDLRFWHEWKKLDNQLSEDLPQGVFAHNPRHSKGANTVFRSSETPVSISTTQKNVHRARRAETAGKESSFWEQFRNPTILAATFFLTLLLRLFYFLMKN